MNVQTNPVRTYPGTYVSPPPQAKQQPMTPTCFTMVTDYNSVKHMISSKPLRRPNRTRPL